MSLVGKPAPDFTAPTVIGDGSFKDDFKLSSLKDRYVMLFFYPLDFTFVCPTEIIEFDKRLDEFRERNVEVVGVSVDSKYSHVAWRNTSVEEGGIGNIRYPLVSDITKQISRDYDVLVEKEGVALRGTFLIDRQGVVRHAVINDLGLGRNIGEALRMVDALQHLENHGEVCPANWEKGEEAMKPSASGVANYLRAHR
jgi:peroxiredoxin (alkyl hydroperoxide reductase subunit C)